jgi:hypothetical protein
MIEPSTLVSAKQPLDRASRPGDRVLDLGLIKRKHLVEQIGLRDVAPPYLDLAKVLGCSQTKINYLGRQDPATTRRRDDAAARLRCGRRTPDDARQRGATLMPVTVAVHDGLDGEFLLLDFDEARSIGYIEYPTGVIYVQDQDQIGA